MKRPLLIAAVAACVLAIAAPAASAQTQLSGTYHDMYTSTSGHPICPGDAFACGTGTATGLGAFTDALTFNGVFFTRTLTFADGSTLALFETVDSYTAPGGAGSSNMPGSAWGHPGAWLYSWTVVGGTGSFAGATGSGTDSAESAGHVATGALSGTITS